MEIDSQIAMEVGTHEAICLQAYKDGGGVWTWSVGLTNSSGHNVTRYINNPTSLQYAVDVWIWALRKYADTVNAVLPGVPKNVFAGALSFHWNTGDIRNASWVKSYKRGDLTTAQEQIMWYKKPTSIIDRRKAERDLIFKNKWLGDGKITLYPVKNNYPAWSQGKRIDISAELKQALGESVALTPELATPTSSGNPWNITRWFIK